MRRCRGKTKTGSRCLKNTLINSGFCNIHQSQAPRTQEAIPTALGFTAIGAAIGNLPGAAVGLVLGTLLGTSLEEEKVAKSRVFVSFDYDHDVDLKTLLIGQAKNTDTPFDIADWSIKEHIRGDWKEKVRAKLKKVDQVVVICGSHTQSATGVSAEVKLAQEEKIPYFLLKGRANSTCYKPKAAKTSDKLYKWTWDNLKSLIGGGR